jgi:hypothetical protein
MRATPRANAGRTKPTVDEATALFPPGSTRRNAHVLMLSSLKLSPVDKNASPRLSTRPVRIERFTHHEGADQPPEVLLGIYRRDVDGTTTEVRAAARGLPAVLALVLVLVLGMGIVAMAMRARHREAPGLGARGCVERVERVERIDHVERIERIERRCDLVGR